MKNQKFSDQLKKNKNASTSTDAIADSLYKEADSVHEETETVKYQSEPVYRTFTEPARVKSPVGRPKGDNTIQKTVYIPEYLWPYVQAAVKQNGGNMQKYFNSLIEADIAKNRSRYNAAAELYMSLNDM